ncbi:endonuclease domain-containing protein [Streptomyces sp. NPDC001002]
MCGFGGCARAASARRLCTGHYQQHRAGKPLSPLGTKRANGAIREMAERGIVECLGCGEHKPISEFSPLTSAGPPRPYCKPCNSERVRLGNYRVTKEFVDLLLEFQGKRCAICGAPDAGAKAMHIDHDHGCCPGRRSCGDCVRALLCSTCNWRGLAWYEALPVALRTFDVLNDYMAHPPARRLRTQLVATREG